MNEAPILICYDGSEGAARAIDAAAVLLGARRAIVIDVGPPLTPAESLAVLSPVAPAAAFEEWNEQDARTRAQASSVPEVPGSTLTCGAVSRRRAGKASSTSRTRSTRP